MNSIIIMGRATRDAEIKYSNGEKPVAYGSYTLAVDRPYRKDKEKETDFIVCKVVGRYAEFAEKYITTGTKMIIRGRMQIDKYEDSGGNKRSFAYVQVEQQEFAESKKAGEGSGSESSAGQRDNSAKPDSDGFMNIPDGLEDEELPFN